MAKRLFQLDLSKVEVSTEMIKREELDNVVLPEEDKPEDTVYSELKDDGVDIEKDTAALEDISNQLDAAIQVQSDLTDQLEANKTIDNPTTENVADSEVAIESALVKLGVSREDYGLHTRTYKSLSVSQEGIKTMLENVAKFIKDLVKKVIRFFKDLWTKIKLKFGNYKPKLDLVKSALKNIDENKFTNTEVLGKVAEDLTKLNLASVELFLGRLSSAPYPKPYNNEFLKQIKVVIEDGARIFKEFCKRTVMLDGSDETAKSIADLLLDYMNKRKPDELDKEFLALSTVNSSNLGSMCIGCHSDNILGFFIHRQDWHDQYSGTGLPGWHTELRILEEKINQSSFVETKIPQKTKWDYRAILESYSTRLPEIYKMVNSNEISDRVLAVQQTLDKSIVDLRKGGFGDLAEHSNKKFILVEKLATNQFTNSVKKLAVDLPVLMTKVYIATIRDYLVIANVLIKNFSK